MSPDDRVAPTGGEPAGGPSTVTVVGIGADGWAGLPEPARALVQDATTLIAGHRLLADLPTVAGQQRLFWPSPLRAGLPDLLATLDGGPVVALASGDPLVSGVGTLLIELLGADRVRIHPAVSSVALARARLGWSAESVGVVSVVGRNPHLVVREFAPGRRLIVLSSDERTPERVAALLVGAGYGDSELTVLGDLGTRAESRVTSRAADWSGPAPRLNVICLELTGPLLAGWVPGLPDDCYEHDGQLTKRDLRAGALARLAPVPGQHLWDVGAGAGSIGIEWMRAHPTCTATAIESHSERAERIVRNAVRLGVPGLRVVTGSAPAALADLPAPDAIFIGGGATVPGLLDACLAALPIGGRLVAQGVTVQTEQLLAERQQQHGGELTRVAVEVAGPLGSQTGWTPLRTVTRWAISG